MTEAQEQLNLQAQIIERVKQLVEESKLAGYSVDFSHFSPQDPEIAFRILGPIQNMRLILSDRDDGSVQLQIHNQYPTKEVQVIYLELPSKGPQSFTEYKVVYNQRNESMYTTPTPISAGVREETLQTFNDLLDRIKS
ncbi:hypothetical protein HY404_01700 [Candidatus Microgenomates bacterium]|nr:hypothetical protein [Candidatus Microgenomates bacterium]